MRKKILISILSVVLILPSSVAFAQLHSYGNGISLPDLMNSITNLVGFVFGGIVVVMFVAAAILFLTAQGDPAKIKIAKDAFIWGVAGVVVGLIAFSIIAIISGLL